MDAADSGEAGDAGDASGACVVATTIVIVVGNLDSTSTPPVLPWDPQNPQDTSNLSTSISVYDSLGAPHTLNAFFANMGTTPEAWTYHVLAWGDEVTPPVFGDSEIITGVLMFDATGALASDTLTWSGPVTFEGATSAIITFDLGDPTADGGTGVSGLTSFAGPAEISSESQNGRNCLLSP